MIRKLPVAFVLGAIFVVAQPAAANASGYLDEATLELQSSPVYVSAQVADVSDEDAADLVANIGDQDIAIVVLPANAGAEIGDINGFISDVAGRTGYDTILVSIGGDFEAGSRVLPSGEASQLANEAEHTGSLSDGLNQFVDGVESVGVAQPPASSGGDDGAGLIVGGVISGVLVLALSGAVTFYLIRRKSRKKKRLPKELEKRYDTPREIVELLEKVALWRDATQNQEVVNTLMRAETHVHEFFRRTRKHIPDRIQEMTGHYNVHLESMITVLSKYVDVEQHPEYTRDPRKILALGERAVQQFERGVIQNIQEVEEGSITATLVDAQMVDAMVKEETPNYLTLGNRPEPAPTSPEAPTKKRKRN